MDLSFRHYYWRWFKNLIFLFLIILVCMTLARTGFALNFGEWRELSQDWPSLQKAFLLGLRYDLIPLAYINAVPFLLLNIAFFIPGKRTIRITRFVILSFLIGGYLLLGWIYVFDYAFYSYYQEHLNILFFGFFEDDTRALLTSVWKNYNLPVWLSLFFIMHYVFIKLIRFLFSMYDFDLKTKKFDYRILLCLFTGLVLIVFFGRGSFKRLPLSLEDAHISTNIFVNQIPLNGVITFNRAMKIRQTHGNKSYDYLRTSGFQNWEDAYHFIFSQSPKQKMKESLYQRSQLNPEAVKNPPHVVLVVMESFGSYWNDYHSESFNILAGLEKHFKTGLLFKNFLSADNGTIGSMVSVAASQVIRPGARFLTESEFMATPLASAGHLPYRKAGYDTHFVY
jgi:hypothetical protein